MSARRPILYLLAPALFGAMSLLLLPGKAEPTAPPPDLWTGFTPRVDIAALMQEANEDLDAMAQELAKLAATPGFRGYIRSEITNSRNVEGIIELDPFLERASKRPDAPSEMGKYRELAKGARGRVNDAEPGSAFKGYDLYIPVEAHRTKWRGGDDFVVAFAPFGDDKAVKEITAYSVRDGKKVVLDAAKAPDTVVLIVAPCEHRTHAQEGTKPRATPPERTLPKPDATGTELEEKPVEQEEGNSYVGIRRLLVRDMQEPWWLGAAEVYINFAHRRGSTCIWSHVPPQSASVYWADWPNTFYGTWDPRDNSRCGNGGAANNTCFYFDDSHSTRMVMQIMEDDFCQCIFDWRTPFVFTIEEGVLCSFSNIWSSDDRIASATVWRNNFPFNSDFNHDMGNAYVQWHKVH